MEASASPLMLVIFALLCIKSYPPTWSTKYFPSLFFPVLHISLELMLIYCKCKAIVTKSISSSLQLFHCMLSVFPCVSLKSKSYRKLVRIVTLYIVVPSIFHVMHNLFCRMRLVCETDTISVSVPCKVGNRLHR
jgi:hypothetical protein